MYEQYRQGKILPYRSGGRKGKKTVKCYETSQKVRNLWWLNPWRFLQADIIKVFAAAQAAAPAVVFIDDADIVIGGWRPLDGHRGSDVFRFLLGRMDGLTSRGKRQRENGDVVVILTGQNVHWMADMLLRSGRIELWLKTKLPEPRQKREILKKYIKEDGGALELLGKNGELPDVKAAAQASDSFCCADLRRVVSDAKMLAAWDRSSDAKILDGAAYLEKAAEGVRRMQDEVHSNARNLYGWTCWIARGNAVSPGSVAKAMKPWWSWCAETGWGAVVRALGGCHFSAQCNCCTAATHQRWLQLSIYLFHCTVCSESHSHTKQRGVVRRMRKSFFLAQFVWCCPFRLVGLSVSSHPIPGTCTGDLPVLPRG